MVMITALATPSASIINPLKIRRKVRSALSAPLEPGHARFQQLRPTHNTCWRDISPFCGSSHPCLIQVSLRRIWRQCPGSLVMLLRNGLFDQRANLDMLMCLKLVPRIWLSQFSWCVYRFMFYPILPLPIIPTYLPFPFHGPLERQSSTLIMPGQYLHSVWPRFEPAPSLIYV